MTTTERLTPDDQLFLDLEDGSDAHMHVASLLRFDGSPPAQDELLEQIEARLDNVPRYRQRLAFVPGGQARPRWIDDERFDLSFHVRRTAVPAPGSDQELRALAGRVLAQRLDRDRPLWEIWLIEGLEDGGFAVITKTHHCMVDGVSAVDVLTLLLDAEPEGTPLEPADAWMPQPAPGTATLLADAGREVVEDAVDLAKRVVGAVRKPGEALNAVRALGSSARVVLGSAAAPAPDTSINGRVGPHRRFAWVSIPFEDVKTVRRAHDGVTVNDVVLAIVAGGLQRTFERRGEAVPATLRGMVPVNVRAADGDSGGNQVGALYPDLPVAADDHAARLRTISEEMGQLKGSGQALGAKALLGLAGFAPAQLVSLASREAASARVFNLTVTNVPGPQVPLYLAGRRMTLAVPMVPLGHEHGLGIAVFSYDGQLTFGLLGERDLLHDLDDVAVDLHDAARELVDSTR